MKERFYLFKRNGIYYVEDGATGRQHSLKTTDGTAARRILRAKIEAARSPMLNVAMAKVYLSAHDPKMLERTWQDVMNEFCSRGKQQTQEDRRRVAMRRPQNLLRNLKLAEEATATPGCPIAFQAAAQIEFLPEGRADEGEAAGEAVAPLAPASRRSATTHRPF